MKTKIIFSLALLSMGYSDEFSVEEATTQIEIIIADIAEEISTVPDMMQAPVETTDQKEIAWGFKSKKTTTTPELSTVQEILTLPVAQTAQETPSMDQAPMQAVPPAPIAVENYNDITKKGGWITAEFLYWQPSVSGITIGLKTELKTFESIATPITPKEHHISYDYFPGFRVGLGCRFPYDHWDLSGQWTQLNAHGRKTLHSTEKKTLITTWPTIANFLPPTSISAKGNINLKIADLELGKVFYVSRPFSLRPSIGARGVRIHQGIKLNHIGVVKAIGLFSGITGTEHLHLQNQYLAGGLRGALAAQWNFSYGWAFYGKTGISLLWGKFKASIHELFIGESFPSGTHVEQPYDQTNNFNAVKSAYDLTAGLSWSKVFSQRTRLSFNLGYEFNFWPNQEEIKNLFNNDLTLGTVTPTKQSGDLGFQGLNAGLQLDF